MIWEAPGIDQRLPSGMDLVEIIIDTWEKKPVSLMQTFVRTHTHTHTWNLDEFAIQIWDLTAGIKFSHKPET